MKIKLDENLPASIIHDLKKAGHDADSVMDEGIAGYPDADVFLAAQTDGRFLITQDLDFSDARRTHPEHTTGFSCCAWRPRGARHCVTGSGSSPLQRTWRVGRAASSWSPNERFVSAAQA